MTRDDVIRMARDVDSTPYTNRHYPDRPYHTFSPEQLEHFAQLVVERHLQASGQYLTNDASREAAIAEAVAAEREACAKVCEELARQVLNENFVAKENRGLCASAIRQRGAV